MAMDPTDQEFLARFRMPNGLTITGRASSIRNVFVAAIAPKVQPTAAEIATVLTILGLDLRDLRCAYCGDISTEWEHLRPLVRKGRPTGYPSSIRNLVPACGKCNQSKGSKDWKEWMQGKARLSPASRGKLDLLERIERLEAYEVWAQCQPLDIQAIVDGDIWKEYWDIQERILDLLKEGQTISKEIAQQIARRALSE